MSIRSRLRPDQQARLEAVPAAGSPSQRLAAAEEVLTEALGSGDPAFEFAARLEVAEQGRDAPTDESFLVQYAALRQSLEGPLELDADDVKAVVRAMKWALALMLRMPTVSLQYLESTINDVDMVFSRYGFHRRPILSTKAELAMAQDNRREATILMQQWTATPRDELSDDEANEHLIHARVVALEDPKRALDEVRLTLQGRLVGHDEPTRSRAYAADWNFRLGNEAAARELATLSAREAGRDPRLADVFGYALITLARTGRLARAIDLLIPHMSFLDEPTLKLTRARFAACAAGVLTAGRSHGLAPATIGSRPIGRVIADLAERATSTATAFDTRNDSPVIGQELRSLMDQSQIPPPSRVVRQLLGAELANTESIAGPMTVSWLASRLEQAYDTYASNTAAILDLWLARRDEVLATPVSFEDAAALATLERGASRRAPTAAQRAELLDAAEAAAARSGNQAEMLRTEAERLLYAPDRDSPEATARLNSIAQRLVGLGNSDYAISVLTLIAAIGGPGAMTAAQEAADLAGRVGRRLRKAQLLAMMAGMAQRDFTGAPLALLDEALVLAADHPVRADLLTQKAWILTQRGLKDEALAAARQARTVSGIDTETAIQAGLLVADLLMESEDYISVEPVAAELIEIARAAGDQAAAARATRILGVTLSELGRYLEAVDELEGGLAGVRRYEPQLMASTSWTLALALQRLGEWGPAATAYSTAAEAFDDDEQPQAAADAHLKAAEAALRTGDVAAADTHLEAAVASSRAGKVPDVFVAARQQQAEVALRRGDTPAALELLNALIDEVPRFLVEVGLDPDLLDNDSLVTTVAFQASDILARSNDPEAGIELLQALDQDVMTPYLRIKRTADIGIMTAQSGDLDGAGTIIRQALAGFAEIDAQEARQHYARAWANQLWDHDRANEANVVWQEYVLPPAGEVGEMDDLDQLL